MWVYGVPTRPRGATSPRGATCPRSADLPTKSRKGASLATPLFLIMSDLPTDLPRKKGSLNLLKLCTRTSHDELLFLYLQISAKQIPCGFTECRLARGVPTCPRGATSLRGATRPRSADLPTKSRKGASLATPHFLIMSSLPPELPPSREKKFL